MNFRINFGEASWDYILFIDISIFSAVQYYEQYYNMLMYG
jgi:hypothetical protein